MTSKTIVLTGAGRGLGQAMCEAFVAAGHTVHACTVSDQSISRLSSTLPAPHSCSQVDITCDSSVQQWAEQLWSQLDQVDLLVNNAGMINQNAPLWEVPVDEFHRVMEVNVNGTFHVLRHFLPKMLEQRNGVIVNFSSTWGRTTSAEVAPYCASKFAIEGLTQSLAKELPTGMAAVAFNPGVINTDMLQSCFGDHAASYPTAQQWSRRAVPFLLQLSAHDNGRSVDAP